MLSPKFVIALTISSLLLGVGMAQGQAQPAPRQPAGQPAPAKPSAPAVASSPADPADAAKKAEILNSSRWRRAMFEFNEWLTAQPIYDQKQVAQIKANLNNRVAKMSASELQFMLEDMEAKFQILDSKPAQEARQWMAQYLSVLSDKKREEVLKDLPNLATMTAAQLNQEIQRIEEKRASMTRQQAAFNQTREAEVNTAIRADQAAQRAYQQAANRPPATFSPYRSQPEQKPFSDVQIGPRMGYYVTPYGGVGLMFGNGW